MGVKLDELLGMDRTGLITAWEASFEKPPPSSTSQEMMRLIVGWDIQARGARTDVRALSSAAGKMLRAGSTDDAQPTLVKPKTVLSPGTRLSREWQGRTYSVDVLDKGYAYDGTLFTSLSSIAKAITGSHRSGPHFFGVST